MYVPYKEITVLHAGDHGISFALVFFFWLLLDRRRNATRSHGWIGRNQERERERMI